jgi:TonB-dependent receptor
VQLTAGYAYLDNDRQFEQRDFRFQPPSAGLTPNQQLQRVDFFFANPNIGPNGLQLQETTGSDGAAAYDAQLEVHAVYAQAEAELGESLRLTGGVRFEDAVQTVRPFDLFGGPAPEGAEPIEEQYVLPAVTATYIFADGDMQVRAGASKTIARPQFRELAPSTFLDPDNDRLFVGNQFLTDSELLNLDARYEWYFGSKQFLNAGVFYKDIDRPIEVIVGGSTADIVTTFINAPRAVLYGAEFEVRKYTRLFETVPFFADKRFLTALNYTYSKSEVRVEPDDEVFPASGAGRASPASLFFRDGQPLQGQSDHLLNLQFGYESDDQDTGSQATFLVTYVSDRVSARGRPGQPDFTESPGVRLDFVFRKGFVVAGRPFRFGVEARNLTGENFEEFQEQNGRIDLNTYDIGQSLSFSLSTTFGG